MSDQTPLRQEDYMAMAEELRRANEKMSSTEPAWHSLVVGIVSGAVLMFVVCGIFGDYASSDSHTFKSTAIDEQQTKQMKEVPDKRDMSCLWIPNDHAIACASCTGKVHIINFAKENVPCPACNGQVHSLEVNSKWKVWEFIERWEQLSCSEQ